MSAETTRLFDPEPVKQWLQPEAGPWVTKALIAVNVIVYLAMGLASKGTAFYAPTTEFLVQWQANWAPLTLGGEPWRLLTSCFLHIGFIHILFNMVVLWQVGTLCEGLFGHPKYLVLYVTSGLAGSVLSALLTNGISAGASGAIAGIMGAYVAFLTVHKQEIEPQTFNDSLKGMGFYLLYCIIYGLAVHADHAAHFGGLAAGFLIGKAMVPKGTRGFNFGFGDCLLTGAAAGCIALVFYLAAELDFTGAVHWHRAEKLTDAKNYAEALKCWQEGVERDPKSQGMRRNLAAAYLSVNQPEQALVAENAAMQLGQPEAEDYRTRAQIYAKLSSWHEAIADASQALKLAPDDATARFIRLGAAMELDQTQLAVDDGAALVKQHPDNATCLILDATANYIAGNPDEIIKDCQALPKDTPKDQASNGELLTASAYAMKGDFRKALEIIDKSPITSSDLFKADRIKAIVYLSSNDTDKARAVVAQLLKDHPKDKDTLMLEAQVAWQSRDYKRVCEATETAFDTSDTLHPSSRAYPAFLNFLAARLCNSKQPDKLLKQIKPTIPASDWTAKVTAYLLGELSADTLIADASSLGQRTEAHCYVGLCLAQDGHTKEAREHLMWVANNGVKVYMEYAIALSALKGL